MFVFLCKCNNEPQQATAGQHIFQYAEHCVDC